MAKRARRDLSGKGSTPTSGIAVAACIWFWAAMAFYAPTYFGLASGALTASINIVGAVLLTVSISGALLELSKLWKRDALSYWGTGVVFLLPALGLHLATVNNPPAHKALEIPMRIGVYAFLAIGSPFIFMGLSHLSRKTGAVDTEQGQKASADTGPAKPRRTRGETARTVLGFIVVLLNLVTAIIKLVAASGA
jgi:hypothetical protein